MYNTKLRKVGGSVVLTVPPAILALLSLDENSQVAMDIEDGKLRIIPKPNRYTMADLLAQSDYSQPQSSEEREWVDAPAVGGELI